MFTAESKQFVKHRMELKIMPQKIQMFTQLHIFLVA